MKSVSTVQSETTALNYISYIFHYPVVKIYQFELLTTGHEVPYP